MLLFVLTIVSALALPLPTLSGDVSSLSFDHELTVVFVVDARRLRLVKAWEVALDDRYDRITTYRVASLPADADLDAVRRRLTPKIPPEVSVHLDAGGSWASEFDLDISRPNLLFFDSQGTLFHRVEGRYSRESFDQLTLLLDSRGPS